MDQVNTGVRFRYKLGRGLLLIAVGLLLLGWLLNTPPGIFGKADAVGYAVCHRIDARSFHLGDRQIPLCARCSGMYLGAMLGLAYQAVIGRKRGGLPPNRVWVVMGLFVAAFAIDGLNSYLHLPFFSDAPSLYQPSNTMRLITGTMMGLAIAGVLYPSFNQTMFVDWKAKPALPGLRSLGILLLLALILDFIILTENPIVLYPLSLVSAFGVLALLTLVYTMLWLVVFRKENSIKRINQLMLPLVGGFGMALLQIAVLDFIRYILTGSWDGFHLG
jgi:uncharacterized membrane protein